MAEQLAALQDLKRLRNLKQAQVRMQKLLGVAGSAAWVDEEEVEARSQSALLRAEALARMREATAPPRKLRLSLSFRLAAGGDGGLVRVPLPHSLHKVRAIEVVGGALPHPLANSFRPGRDDCMSFAYTQQWDVRQLRVRCVRSTETIKQPKQRVQSRLVINPDVVPGSAGTARTCFAQAAAGAGAIALESVMNVRLLGLLGLQSFVIMVGPFSADTPTGALYSLRVPNKYQVHLRRRVVGEEEVSGRYNADSEQYISFYHDPPPLAAAAGPSSSSWAVDGDDYLRSAPPHPLSLELLAEYNSKRQDPTTVAVADFITAAEHSGVVLLLGDSVANGQITVEREARAVIQVAPSTLDAGEAAFVLETAFTQYAQLLELGAPSSPAVPYLRIGTFGERLSFLLDPPTTAAVTKVAFLFKSAKPADRDRQAALALGFVRRADVIFLRGVAVVAPAPYMHHRLGRMVRVDCAEAASRVNGAHDKAAWFEYGAHDEHHNSAGNRQTIYIGGGGGGRYGRISFSPEMSKLDALTIQFRSREGRLEDDDDDDDMVAQGAHHTTYSIALEAEVAP